MDKRPTNYTTVMLISGGFRKSFRFDQRKVKTASLRRMQHRRWHNQVVQDTREAEQTPGLELF